MKFALAQLNYTVGDLDNNRSKIIGAIAAAKEAGADLVVFAEYAVSGCPCYDLLQNATFLEACENSLGEIAAHCDGIAALIGTPVQENNCVVSAAALVQDRKITKYIGKHNVHSREESSLLNPSGGCEYIEVGGKKIAVAVGEDLVQDVRHGKNADVIVSLYAQPYHRGVIEERYRLMQKISYTAGVDVVCVNHLGGQSDLIFDGSSCAWRRDGKPVTVLKSFEEDLVIIDPETAPEVAEPRQCRTHNTYRAIKLGLSDFFRKNGFTKACLGLSGGIDSAVVLALAAEVLPPQEIKVLLLPSQFSTEHSVSDSVEMARRLGVEYEIIPIKEAYDAVTASLSPILKGTTFDVTEENIQSRLRCVMLMALSNKGGHILLNTSNKSEAAVGYGTLYGDCSGAIGPIGDLYKIEVYELARYINREREVIPENIILKAPSAELRPDQMDSDSLPPYEVMDAVLFRFIEEGQSAEEIIGSGFDGATVRRILGMVKSAEFKRRQCPPPLRLSGRPFSSHFVLPLLSKFNF